MAWEIVQRDDTNGKVSLAAGSTIEIGGERVVNERQAGIEDATENLAIVTTQLNLVIQALRDYGVIDSEQTLSSSSSSSSSYVENWSSSSSSSN